MNIKKAASVLGKKGGNVTKKKYAKNKNYWKNLQKLGVEARKKLVKSV